MDILLFLKLGTFCLLLFNIVKLFVIQIVLYDDMFMIRMKYFNLRFKMFKFGLISNIMLVL